MRRIPSLVAAAVVALPFFAFGCVAEPVDEIEPFAAEDMEVTAEAEQAITASQRQGIGKIFDTGAAMGFAEFFASLVNWDQPASHTQGDYDRMNASLVFAGGTPDSYPGAPPLIPGTFDGIKLAISSPLYSPMRPVALSKDYKQPYATVNAGRQGIRNNIYAASTYAHYYDLGVNLAIAEGQAYITAWAPLSWQYSCWALDSALYAANGLAGRVQINRNALSTLRNSVCNGSAPTTSAASASVASSIKTLREQYAMAIYTTAETVCGNGVCDAGETSSSCSTDCYSAPPPSSGPCPNNPNGQPNTYQFCIVCPAANWYYTRTDTGCTQSDAFNWAQGTTNPNCLIYYNACP